MPGRRRPSSTPATSARRARTTTASRSSSARATTTARCATSVAPAVGDLVITEVMPKPDAGQRRRSASGSRSRRSRTSISTASASIARATRRKPEVIDVAGLHARHRRQLRRVRAPIDTTMNGGLPAADRGTFTFSLDRRHGDAPGDVQIVCGRHRDRRDHVDALDDRRVAPARSRPRSIRRERRPSRTSATATVDLRRAATSARRARDNAQCPLLPPPGMCIDGGTIRARS